jgi:signal transduction histidine kinase
MYRMVLDLLELARLDSGIVGFERAPLRVDELLAGIVESFTPQAMQKQIRLDLDCENDLPIIVGDADRLVQVFSNLVDNALNFTPTGGEVLLEAQRLDGWLQVEVSDTGPGIPDEDLERIFERFYRTDKSRRGRKGRGVGLGLAISREIVLAHGGTIAAYNRDALPLGGGEVSSEGLSKGGSVFVVKIPLARSEDTAAAVRRN